MRIRVGMLARLSCSVLLAAAGCGGGSSGSTPDGGGGAIGGGGGGGAGAGTGGGGGNGSGGGTGGGTGDASDPSCAGLGCLQHVQDLMLSCQATASCVSQIEGSGKAACYDNGVKILVTQTVSSTSNEQTVQVKNGATVCFSRTFDLAPSGSSTSYDITTKDASGTVLATAHVDDSGAITVTCPGGQPTAYTDGTCGTSSLIVTGAYVSTSTTLPDCTDGTCAF